MQITELRVFLAPSREFARSQEIDCSYYDAGW